MIPEFPTVQAALDWYAGEAYTATRRIREHVARASTYVVEGMERSTGDR